MTTTTTSPAIEELNRLLLEENRLRCPSFPDHLRTVAKYDTRKANGLTRAVIHFLRLKGCQAERISVMGRVVNNTKTFKDVVGHTRKIGSMKYIPSTMQRGSADISATINGRSVKIEIKVGKDKQSEYQRQYQEEVEAAGGIYYIARDFEAFYEWYNMIINKE